MHWATFFRCAAIVSTLALATCGTERAPHAKAADDIPRPTFESPPHILVILADDLGYGSLNSYGASTELIKTPRIDSIAAHGVRFTNAYAPSSVCSPTRYGVLMGRYPWRTQKKAGVVGKFAPLWPSPERISVAKWLKDRGYTTASIGKWHLGYGSERHSEDIEEWIATTTPGPHALGFDYNFSVPHNHGDVFGAYIENDKIVGIDDQGQLLGLQSTERKDYGQIYNGSAPFLGFDVPQRIDERVTADITDRAIRWMEQTVKGGDAPFFLYFNPVAVHNPITPSASTAGSSGVGAYGDFIHDLDHSIGRVLDSLEDLGIADNTIIIFTSDNGAAIPGTEDSAQRIAIKKGLQVNDALRGGKLSIWEGGTRIPLIVRVPGVDPAQGARQSDALVNLTDIFATLADLLGDGINPADDIAPDSVSFVPALLNQEGLRSSTVTASYKGILAIRSGDWKWIEGQVPEGFDKLMGMTDPPAAEAKAQLYNLGKDAGETLDVSADHAAKVDQLRAELNTIRGTILTPKT